MYENNNTVSIDWKGLFIKLIIVAIIIFVIFKGYEYFSNKKTTATSTSSTATQLFNANLESLRQAGENYYDYKNYPAEGQTVMVTLGELITKGNIKELYDEKGNECNRENSYVSVTNDGGQYKLKVTLSCDGISDTNVVTIGCECEENECTEVLKQIEEEKETSSKDTSDSSSSSKKPSSNKTTNNNNKPEKTTTSPKPTQANNNTTTTTTTTTQKVTYENLYKVTFDSNGGTKVDTQYVEKNETAYKPENPEKDNANFVGWYYKGKLFNFNTAITKDITLEAYYWETKETNPISVYSSAWDAAGTTYVTVSHQLAIPEELIDDYNDGYVKNVRIKRINSYRTMKYYNDLVNYVNRHSTTYENYNYAGTQNHYYGTTSNLAYMTGIRVNKTYYNKYDRWVTWSAYVGSQCSSPYTFDGKTAMCDYGIVYDVVWEYQEFTD